jgi:uncharacterized lipoprotein YmbA
MRHYLLQPNAAAEQIPLEGGVVVTLESLRLPAYLDRLQLTTYDNQNQVLVAKLDRWSEPLQEGFTRVLSENLLRHLEDGEGRSQSIQEVDKERFLVKLKINSFDGMLGQQTTVDIRWTIIKVGIDGQVLQGHFVETTPIGSSYPDLVKGLNLALNNLSYKIAREIVDFK